MTILKTVNEQDAQGKVAEIYEQMKGIFGGVPNALKVFSASPFLLEQQWKNLGYYFHHQSIDNELTAYIRMLVSVSHTCKYCIDMNMGLLMQGGAKLEDLQSTMENPENAKLDEKRKAMLLFVLKVVHNSNHVEAEDLDKLRNLGWNDGEILEATYHGTSQIGVDAIFNAFKIDNDY